MKCTQDSILSVFHLFFGRSYGSTNFFFEIYWPLRQFISSIAEFLTWIVSDLEWENSYLDKENDIFLFTFLLWHGIFCKLTIRKDYFNILQTKQKLMLESMMLRSWNQNILALHQIYCNSTYINYPKTLKMWSPEFLVHIHYGNTGCGVFKRGRQN